MRKKLGLWNKRRRNRANRPSFRYEAVMNSVSELETYSESQLRSLAEDLRELASVEQNKSNEYLSTQKMMPVVIEVIRRTQGFLLHSVQIEAALASANGQIIEMHTGEGKTVVTGAAAILRVLVNQHVHVATTNDYLATRDYETLAPAFEMLGIKSGLLPREMNRTNSRRAYEGEITYGPGYQFGFDFLFDQITMRDHNPSQLGRSIVHQLSGFELEQQLVQCHGLDACIVDEVDSVLIDEATTPLILSFESDKKVSELPFQLSLKVAHELLEDEHFRLDFREKQIEFTESGHLKIQEFRRARNLQLERPWRSYVKSALHAKYFLMKNRDYVVQDGEVNIVDPFTGRIFDDRSWQGGLHQAVEAKENVEINTPRVSKARITRQRFMGFYQTLCGLSGTAMDGRRDFQEFYQVGVIPIPTHLPCRRQVHAPRFFADQEAKIGAMISEVRRLQKFGQPVLIGTGTIHDSIAIQEGFAAAGIDAVVLNGVQDQEEAEIVAAAGREGAITIATNMAGRGTDIKLTEVAKAAGGLHVIGASPNASARVDRQLVGRAARQGQPGSAQFFVSADDELLARFSPSLVKMILRQCAITGEANINGAQEIASLQSVCENEEFNRRQDMVRRDNWMDTVRDSLFGETANV